MTVITVSPDVAARVEGTPPQLDGAVQAAVPAIERSLRLLNRGFMVPAIRLGLSAWLGSPVGGYILLLRVRGRKTGAVRDTPLSYLIADGSVWVMAGFGSRTQWFRNLQADPIVDVWLPGRVVRCRAEEATDPAIRRRIMPGLTRAAGMPGLLIGCNPWRASDDRILGLLSPVPLVRLAPFAGPIAAGPDDPGGHGWTWRQGLLTAATAWLVVAGARRR